MHKKDLIDVVLGQANPDHRLTRAAVSEVIEVLGDVILEGVAKGDEIPLASIGKFTATSRAARTGRNPRTGESIQLKATTRLVFKAGKRARDVLNPES